VSVGRAAAHAVQTRKTDRGRSGRAGGAGGATAAERRMGKKECVKVLVRTRPTANFSQDQIVIDHDKNAIRIVKRDGEEAGAGGGGAGGEATDNRKDSWNFQFNKVLHNTGQETMYGEAAQPIVEGVVEGVNGTVMAYGQTGAGKTFTMTGDTHNFKQRGIIPRAISQLFAEIADRPQQEFTVWASFMEIYNEKIFDLLDEESAGSSSSGDKDFQIVEDSRTHSMQVRGLTLEQVNDEEEALKVLFRGEQSRIVAEHQLNKQSNRSHSIFTLHVEQKSRLRAEQVLRSKLNLVDLAGSERLKKAIGEKMDEQLRKESRYINKSLTYLEQVVVALSGPSRTHIPYRQTKLTNILKDSLGGNCNTALIACIWGEAKHIEESISTLKLAQRMTRVENQATTNQQSNPALLLKRYERQIRELKQELMMHDALADRSGVSYDEYTPEECRDIAKQVRAFVDASPEEEEANHIQVESVRQVQECFRQFKILVRNVESQVEERLRQQFQFQAKSSQAGVTQDEAKQGDDQDPKDGRGSGDDGVGDADEQGGFALGEAPASAKPKTIEMPPDSRADGVLAGGESKLSDTSGFHQNEENAASKSLEADMTGQQSAITAATPRSLQSDDAEDSTLPQVALTDIPEDRERAFKLFVETTGRKVHAELQSTLQATKGTTATLQRLRREMKSIQAEIDNAQRQVDEIRSEEKVEGKQDDSERIIDEEEYVLLRAIKDHKKQFRQLREAYDTARIDKDGLVETRDEIQAKLLAAFQEWFGAAQAFHEQKNANDDDFLDDGEKFDKLELERVQSEDPDSVAFFKATKAQRERAGRKKKFQDKRV
ncbi:Kinesin-like protein KLP1, partial [Durusdinium trenchii]